MAKRFQRAAFIIVVVVAASLPSTAPAQTTPDSADAPAPAPEPAGPELVRRTLMPVALPVRVPRREGGLAFSASRMSEGATALTSLTGLIFVEATAFEDRFGLRIQLPLASVGGLMGGDLDVDLGIVLWRRRAAERATLVSLGLDVTFPTSLLNTTGGGKDAVRARRIQKYRELAQLDLLPIRYFQTMPHAGVVHREGRLSVYGDLGLTLIAAAKYGNYYGSPGFEAALEYGLGAAYALLEAPSLAAGLELTATHFVTTIAPTDAGPTFDPAAPRQDRPLGLSVVPTVRALFADRVAIDAGVSIALVNDQTWSRYTPSTLWRHDWTLFASASLQF